MKKFYQLKIQKKKETKRQNDNTIKQPLNQILYGLPGTGKIYKKTINKALEIINKVLEFEYITIESFCAIYKNEVCSYVDKYLRLQKIMKKRKKK